MSDKATELLHKLLDERGVEYEAYKDIKNRCITKWRTYHGAFVFFAVEKEGKLFVETASDTEHSAICTPEQAIAATLGSGTCEDERIDELELKYMEAGHVIERLIAERDEWKAKAEEAGRAMNAAAGLWAKADAENRELRKMLLLDDGTVEEYTERANPLTALAYQKQLAEEWRDRCHNAEALCDKLEAERDELNAKLGSGTCELHYGEDDDGYDGWYCDECGGWFQAVRRDGRLVEPKHCQECGKAVKR